jgi:rhomboid protease GluP
VEDDTSTATVEVFRGSQAACFEFGLVLDAKGLRYERVDRDDTSLLLVAPGIAEIAGEELSRYAAERSERPEPPEPVDTSAGSGVGAVLYAFVLILLAYCAGLKLFDLDWLDVGSLRSGAGAGYEWWRAVTALTLHLDQEHLLSNLGFGIGVGILAGRMFGPGVAWLGILLAGTLANYVDMLVSPASHRAVGASTAVFAALGLLSGFAWGQQVKSRRRRFYRWGPLFAGVCLLALLGAGNERVDVLGHLLGFVAGLCLGWGFAQTRKPLNHSIALQSICGILALLLIGAAWWVALFGLR